MLHPWFYPYLIAMGLVCVLVAILIPLAALALMRNIAEWRARRASDRQRKQRLNLHPISKTSGEWLR